MFGELLLSFNSIKIGISYQLKKAIKNDDFQKLRGKDLNQRPPGYEPDELPDCSTPRYKINECKKRLIID